MSLFLIRGIPPQPPSPGRHQAFIGRGERAVTDGSSHRMTQEKYYSPRLHRPLISPLYHAAKAQRIPMTALASRLVAEGLERMNEQRSGDSVVAEQSHANNHLDTTH